VWPLPNSFTSLSMCSSAKTSNNDNFMRRFLGRFFWKLSTATISKFLNGNINVKMKTQIIVIANDDWSISDIDNASSVSLLCVILTAWESYFIRLKTYLLLISLKLLQGIYIEFISAISSSTERKISSAYDLLKDSLILKMI
jgi:hypothetical protein